MSKKTLRPYWCHEELNIFEQKCSRAELKINKETLVDIYILLNDIFDSNTVNTLLEYLETHAIFKYKYSVPRVVRRAAGEAPQILKQSNGDKLLTLIDGKHAWFTYIGYRTLILHSYGLTDECTDYIYNTINSNNNDPVSVITLSFWDFHLAFKKFIKTQNELHRLPTTYDLSKERINDFLNYARFKARQLNHNKQLRLRIDQLENHVIF
jgi:hypothetical protein